MNHFYWEITGSLFFFVCFCAWLWYSARRSAQSGIGVSIKLWIAGVTLFAIASFTLARLDLSNIATGKVGAITLSMAALLAIWLAFTQLLKPRIYLLPVLFLSIVAVIIEIFIDSGPGLTPKRQLGISLYRAILLLHLAIITGNEKKANEKSRHPIVASILLLSVAFLVLRALYFTEVIFRSGRISFPAEYDSIFRASTYVITLVPMFGFVSVFLHRHQGQLNDQQTRAEKFRNLYEITRLCNQAISRLHNRNELLNKIAAICVEHTSVDLVWIGSPGPDGWMTFEAVAGPASNYIDGLKISIDENIAEGRGGTGIALRSRKPVIYNEYGTSDAWHGRRQLYGIQSGATLPFWNHKNRLSCITLYSTEKHFFTEDRVLLLSALAEDLGNALSAIEMRRLRAEALRHVRANRRLLNFALNSASDATWEWHISTGQVVFSRKWRTILGYNEQDLPNSIEAWEKLIFPTDLALMHRKMEAYLAGESPEYRFEFRIRGKDQKLHWIRDTGIILSRDADGRPLQMVGTLKLIDDEIRQKDILAESERRFRLLAENSADLISRHDLEGIFAYISPSFSRVLGYVDSDLIGNSIRTYIHPEDLARVKRPREVLTGPDQTMRMEYRFRKKDGTYLWVESAIKTIMDELQITVLGLQVATRDISERKNAEQSLREHDQFLTSVISSQINGIIVTDATGKITFTNYSAEKILDMKFRTLAGKNISDEALGMWLHPDGTPSNPLFNLLNQTVGKRQNIPEIEQGMRLASGKIKWLSLSASPLYSTENILRGAVISFIDISERIAARTQLELANERLQLAISGANIGIIDVDLDEQQIHLSGQITGKLGIDLQDSNLSISAWLELIHPEDRHAVMTLLRQHFRREMPSFAGEMRLRQHDQKWTWFSARGKFMANPKTGKRRRFSGILSDISERKENELRIQDLTQSVMTIAEKERAELSAELHDTVGQGLILAHLNSTNFLQTTGQRTAEAEQKLLQPLKEVLRITREISRRISPIHMREVGIQAALEEMILSAAKIAGLKAHLELDALDGFFADDWDINCYRVIQEALTNTIKHANASSFSVIAERMNDLLMIEISDDGATFDKDKASPGIGTLIMQERIRILNGNLVAGKRPAGFHIYIEIPRQTSQAESIGIYTE